MQGKATVRAVERKTDFCCFDIELPAARATDVAIGASVAINGTCLTVTSQEGSTLRFDVMAETLRRTNLGALQPGSDVNFERSARVGDEIGGHTVSGHVHTTATIAKVTDTENNRRLEFEVGERSGMGMQWDGGWDGARAGGAAACCHIRAADAAPAAARHPHQQQPPQASHPAHNLRCTTPLPLLLLLQVADPSWMRYVLPKGFVSVDGCSLTVGEVTDRSFSVYLIPETLRWVGGWLGRAGWLGWVLQSCCRTEGAISCSSPMQQLPARHSPPRPACNPAA